METYDMQPESWYQDVAGSTLDEDRFRRFKSFMKEAFKGADADSDYASEWVDRFAAGTEYQLSDSRCRAILDRV